MKKIFLLLLFMFSLISCENDTYNWEFNYEYEQITEIKIIEIIDELEYRELQVIESASAKEIYEDITNIKMMRYGPNLSSPYGMCFMIVFSDGNYDIISQQESKHYIYTGGKIESYNSWLYCDENEFNALIDKYLTP